MRASRCVGVRGARRIEIIGRIGKKKIKKAIQTQLRAVRSGTQTRSRRRLETSGGESSFCVRSAVCGCWERLR